MCLFVHDISLVNNHFTYVFISYNEYALLYLTVTKSYYADNDAYIRSFGLNYNQFTTRSNQ